MSDLSRFLDKRLGLRFDKHTAGNLLKNAAPALAFTGAGALGAGAAGALGERMRGKTNTADILKAGLGSAAMGGGAAGLARGAGMMGGGMGAAPTSEAFSNPGLLSRAGNAVKGAGSALGGMAKKDPLGTVQAIGSVAGGVMDARGQNAALDFQRQQYNDEQERRKRIAQMLAPLYQQLQEQQQPRRY